MFLALPNYWRSPWPARRNRYPSTNYNAVWIEMRRQTSQCCGDSAALVPTVPQPATTVHTTATQSGRKSSCGEHSMPTCSAYLLIDAKTQLKRCSPDVGGPPTLATTHGPRSLHNSGPHAFPSHHSLTTAHPAHWLIPTHSASHLGDSNEGWWKEIQNVEIYKKYNGWNNLTAGTPLSAALSLTNHRSQPLDWGIV